MTVTPRQRDMAQRSAPLVLFLGFALWLGASQANSVKWMPLAIEFAYVAAAAIGVNILLGYTGLLSLGHAGFFVAGGYAGAIFTPYILSGSVLGGFVQHNAIWFGAPVAFVFGASLGALLALMCCHLRGFYLTVVTLAFGAIIPAIVQAASKQLGGTAGRAVTQPPDTSNVLLARHNPQAGVYYVSLVVLLATLFVTWNLVRSRSGRALMAIRESEVAARASGISTYWYKVSSFALSAGIVALAGWVAALRLLSVSSGEPTTLSFRYVIMIILGGIGTLAGPIIGALIVTFGFSFRFVEVHFRNAQGLLFGTLGIVGVALAPEGVVGSVRRAGERIGRLRARRGRVPTLAALRIHVAASPRARADHDGDGAIPVLEVVGLTKRFGGVTAIADLDLTVARHSVHALIGPNGSGKSTFVNVMTGVYATDSGSVRFNGRALGRMSPQGRARVGMARTFQNLQIWPRMSVVENVLVGAHTQSSTSMPASLLGLGRKDERRIRDRSWGLLEFVGLSSRGSDAAGTLALGDQRRLEMARALASDPDLLLLDEPAAGMHPGEIAQLLELITRIRDAGVTVLLVEHHMDLVMQVSDVLTVLDAGEKIAEAPPLEVQRDDRVIRAYLGAAAKA